MLSESPLLFSIDVEEFYPAQPGADHSSSPLPNLIADYLQVLRDQGARATFFVVGEVARRYPAVLRVIAAEGHELGCHGDRHVPLDQLTPTSFREDIRANRMAIEEACGASARGFRAPILSLTDSTSWAHDVLAEEGFEYSSSVLPAPNPLYGWPDFGAAPRRSGGVLEIPVSLASPLGVPRVGAVPLFSGTYFRVMPWPVVERQLRSQTSERPVVCYFHPYDIDRRQRWTMHAGVRGNRLMNALLFARRGSLLPRVASLLGSAAVLTYREYAAAYGPASI